MNRIVTLLIVLLLTGCTRNNEEAIVSIFEYAKPTYEPFTCLSVLGKDPTDALLSTIHHYKPTVVRASECVEEPGGGYRYKGQFIIEIMSISKISWHGMRKVSFEISYITNAPFGGHGETIVVEKLNEFWAPTSHEFTWIS